MRKQTALALLIIGAAIAIPTLPARAGLGGLLKAAAKAGSVADDAARGAAKVGTHVDDAALAGARRADDATASAVFIDGASVDGAGNAARGTDDAAKATKPGDVAKDVAMDAVEQAAGAALEDEPKAPSGEIGKHVRRVLLLDQLDRVAKETNDAPLAAQLQRIRDKESKRHARVMGRAP